MRGQSEGVERSWPWDVSQYPSSKGIHLPRPRLHWSAGGPATGVRRYVKEDLQSSIRWAYGMDYAWLSERIACFAFSS